MLRRTKLSGVGIFAGVDSIAADQLLVLRAIVRNLRGLRRRPLPTDATPIPFALVSGCLRFLQLAFNWFSHSPCMSRTRYFAISPRSEINASLTGSRRRTRFYARFRVRLRLPVKRLKEMLNGVGPLPDPHASGEREIGLANLPGYPRPSACMAKTASVALAEARARRELSSAAD